MNLNWIYVDTKNKKGCKCSYLRSIWHLTSINDLKDSLNVGVVGVIGLLFVTMQVKIFWFELFSRCEAAAASHLYLKILWRCFGTCWGFRERKEVYCLTDSSWVDSRGLAHRRWRWRWKYRQNRDAEGVSPHPDHSYVSWLAGRLRF